MTFVLVTIAVLLASTTLLFGVLWRRERANRMKCERRLEAQEASFAAALGQTHEIAKATREQAERIRRLEMDLTRAMPTIDEMRALIQRHS